MVKYLSLDAEGGPVLQTASSDSPSADTSCLRKWPRSRRRTEMPQRRPWDHNTLSTSQMQERTGRLFNSRRKTAL